MLHAMVIAALSVCPTGWCLRRMPTAAGIILLVLVCMLAGERLMQASAETADAAWPPPSLLG